MRPAQWTGPAFAREVELIRAHLAPIRSRPVLAASFGREAFHGDPSGSGDGSGPVTVAYAIRWLELGDRQARPRWDAWLAECSAAPSAPPPFPQGAPNPPRPGSSDQDVEDDEGDRGRQP
jgi:hypothetical protein